MSDRVIAARVDPGFRAVVIGTIERGNFLRNLCFTGRFLIWSREVRQIRMADGDLIDRIHRFNPCSRGWDARSDGPGRKGVWSTSGRRNFVKGKDPTGLSTNYNCI